MCALLAWWFAAILGSDRSDVAPMQLLLAWVAAPLDTDVGVRFVVRRDGRDGSAGRSSFGPGRSSFRTQLIGGRTQLIWYGGEAKRGEQWAVERAVVHKLFTNFCRYKNFN